MSDTGLCEVRMRRNDQADEGEDLRIEAYIDGHRWHAEDNPKATSHWLLYREVTARYDDGMVRTFELDEAASKPDVRVFRQVKVSQ